MFSVYNKYVMTALISFSIWIVANIINAVLFAFVFAAASSDGLAGIGFVLLCSALFSLPGILIFWIVFLLQCRKDNLFNTLLITALIVSFLSILFFFFYLTFSFGADRGMWVIIMPVLAAVGATAIHKSAIDDVITVQKEIYQLKNSETLET